MGKTIIRLTESDLHKIISDSVYRILEENTNVNEGWKNWAMAGALGAATMFGNPQTANAQNPVVDGLTKPNEVVGEKYDRLLLDPNKSIKENYAKIDSLLSLHREKQYAEYIIMVEGHYTNKRNESYNSNVGIIRVKEKDDDYHRAISDYRTISEQIIEVLTELYANSLDEPFHVSPDQYFYTRVNEKQIDVKTGRSYKHQNGDVSTEYIKKGFGLNTFYHLYTTSPLYKKIHNKVIEETGLKGGITTPNNPTGEPQDINMDNQVKDLPKGVYIINGKKEVKQDETDKETSKPKQKNRKYNDDMYY